MAEAIKSVSIVLLNGLNKPTWKIQCCMVLMKEGLWSIVSGTEQACRDLAACRDRALELIGLHIQPSLLHCMVMRMTQLLFLRKPADQLQKKPEGYVIPGKEHLVCKLKKSIYGLKQSPCCWNTALHNHLKKMDFVQTATNPCVYRSSGREAVHQGVYMDNSIVAAQSDKTPAEVKKERFAIKDLGKFHHFLGMKIKQDEATWSVWIGQPAYTEPIQMTFGMKNAKVSPTPVHPSNKLVKTTEADDLLSTSAHQSAIGSCHIFLWLLDPTFHMQ